VRAYAEKEESQWRGAKDIGGRSYPPLRGMRSEARRGVPPVPCRVVRDFPSLAGIAARPPAPEPEPTGVAGPGNGGAGTDT
jgi:hypothetical protein